MSWRRRIGPKLLVCTTLIGVGVLAENLADARPGGGHSYSGGGGGGGGGGFSGGGGGGGFSGGGGGGFSSGGGGFSSGSYSGGGGDLGGGACGLFGGLTLTLIIGVGTLIDVLTKSNASFDSDTDGFAPSPPPLRAIDWSPLLVRDPQFSPVVFRDFVYQLYARVHEARNDPEAMASLAPYVIKAARSALAERGPSDAKISQVVIGSMQITSLNVGTNKTTVGVRFESNVSAEHEDGRRSTWYLVEDWKLARASTVISKRPEQATALKCPNCGAPFESTADQRCDYCGEIVGNGRFDWTVTRTQLREIVERPPALGGYAPEIGTDRPTLIAPGFAKGWQRLLDDDPKLSKDAIAARIFAIYARLNTAWVARDLSHARPYLSDGIHDYLRYWIDAYQRQGLINCLEDMHVERVEFVKLTRDAWYDALTVRLFASGLDYTIRESDEQMVGGSSTRPRRYSEYWTLIRGAGVRGEAHSDYGCPNCGAPLTVNMAGNCEHCSAHLTRGEFDWVLSQIEQDESYAG